MMTDEAEFNMAHCTEVMEYMALGHSAVAFAGHINVPRAVLNVWAEKHPKFAKALAVGRAKAITFWEQKLSEIARSGKGNASAAIFGLKNAAAEWTSAEGQQKDDAEGEQPWSDLELALRIAHILQLAEHTPEDDKANVINASDDVTS
jgi:hypothetical protein